MNKKIKVYFIWHWQKKTSEELKGAFAAFDSMIHAIALLSKDPGYSVKILTVSNANHGPFESVEQGINYVFFKTAEEIANFMKNDQPDFLFLNHHSRGYRKFIKELVKLKAKKTIYYSASIIYKNPFKQYVTKHHKKLDFHMVHHEYQKQQLIDKFKIDSSKIIIAPKTADLDLFKEMKMEKKWDCIYPCRGGERSCKRPMIAINACKILSKSICFPGAKFKGNYPWVTTFEKWQTPEDLSVLYNQSRCLVITSNYKEMGPRVIMEAAACNLPIVCCSDSPANVSHVTKLGGFIAEPNPEDVARKIQLALKTKVDYRSHLNELGLDYELVYRKVKDILDGEIN